MAASTSSELQPAVRSRDTGHIGIHEGGGGGRLVDGRKMTKTKCSCTDVLTVFSYAELQ